MNISEYWLIGAPLYIAGIFLTLIYIATKIMKLDQKEVSRTTTTRIIELPLKLVVEVTE